MQVQLYGQFDSYYSIPNVSRAVGNTLHRYLYKFGIYHHGSLNPRYIAAPWHISLNSAAPLGLFVGYPNQSIGWLKGHEIRSILTVCETDGIPSSWVTAIKDVKTFVPSTYCKEIFTKAGVKNVDVVRHGVPYWVVGVQKGGNSTNNTFLHVSGSKSFPKRKGTTALLKAWESFVVTYPDAKLHLRMSDTSNLREVIRRLNIESSVTILSDEMFPLGFEELRYYQNYTAIIQPSRAEGFGIVPLEARCLGVPCIITNTSGHTEHFAAGVDVEVKVEATKSSLNTQDNEVGRAFDVTPDAILLALNNFMVTKEDTEMKTKAWAEVNASKWTWNAVLKPLMQYVKSVVRDHKTEYVGEHLGLKGL
jgi:glycosyltransferase involved in cell wall biosynthesis